MFYFINDSSLSVIFPNGTVAAWSNTDPNYKRVMDLAKKENWIAIEQLFNETKLIMEGNVHIDGEHLIIIDDKNNKLKVDLNEKESPNSKLVNFIKLLKDKGVVSKDIDHIRPFLKNMFENPYINAVEEIYDFCKAMDFEITDDGCFLAYKNVNRDLSSIHDHGATKHVIGKYTEVNDFDTDRTITCSRGLHFCSSDYLNSYPGEVTLVVKINPKDVVAIPIDYNYKKGRCKRYLPIGIIQKGKLLRDINIEELSNNQIHTAKEQKLKNMIHGYTGDSVDQSRRTKEIEKILNEVHWHIDQAAQKLGLKTNTIERYIRRIKYGK